jgi:flagellin
MDGQALIETGEGAQYVFVNILQRMREVAVQAANDTNNSQDRDNLQAEMNAMATEIDRIAGTTTWAGANLMEDATTSFSFQVGAATGTQNQISVNIKSMNTDGLSLNYTENKNAVTTAVPASKAADVTFDGYDDDTNVNTADVSIASFSGNTLTIAASGDITLATVDAAVDSTKTAAENATAIQTAWSSLGVTAEADGNDIKLTFAAIELADAQVDGENAVQVGSGSQARAGIVLIDEAIKTVNVQRSELGAVSNRLNHTVNNLTNISSNLSAAKGGIEDADFALETTNLAKNQILQQASTAMLAQANASKQNVLSLLQG